MFSLTEKLNNMLNLNFAILGHRHWIKRRLPEEQEQIRMENTYTDNSSEQARDIGRPFVSNIRRGIQTSTAYNRPPIPPSQTDLPQHLLYIGPAATEQRPCTLLGCNHCHQLNFFSIVSAVSAAAAGAYQPIFSLPAQSFGCLQRIHIRPSFVFSNQKQAYVCFLINLRTFPIDKNSLRQKTGFGYYPKIHHRGKRHNCEFVSI